MEYENFRDEAVAKSLFKFQSQDDVVMSLLRNWPENSRYNQDMARYQLWAQTLLATWPESLSSKLLPFFDRLPIIYAGVDDHRATMAVDALGKSTLVGQQAIAGKKKGGLLGMFGGNDT